MFSKHNISHFVLSLFFLFRNYNEFLHIFTVYPHKISLKFHTFCGFTRKIIQTCLKLISSQSLRKKNLIIFYQKSTRWKKWYNTKLFFLFGFVIEFERYRLLKFLLFFLLRERKYDSLQRREKQNWRHTLGLKWFSAVLSTWESFSVHEWIV